MMWQHQEKQKWLYLLWTFSSAPGFLLISRGKTRLFSFLRAGWSQMWSRTSLNTCVFATVTSSYYSSLWCIQAPVYISITAEEKKEKRSQTLESGSNTTGRSADPASTYRRNDSHASPSLILPRPLTAWWGTAFPRSGKWWYWSIFNICKQIDK